MNRKPVFLVALLFLVSISSFTLKVQCVEASGTVYIRADGSIDPPTAPIQRNGNVYILTGNITSDADGIVVERDNIVVDGSGFHVEGAGASFSNGIYLDRRSNVTIQNAKFTTFHWGIQVCNSSSNNRVSGNTATNNTADGVYLVSSFNNSVSGNTATNNSVCGIHLLLSSNNSVSGNTVSARALADTHQNIGIGLEFSSNNSIIGNTVTHASEGIGGGSGIAGASGNNIIAENNITSSGDGIWLQDASNNTIYHNNFVGNTVQVDNFTPEDANFWDNGSEGNYWSNYNGTDANSDGVGDTPYVIDTNNVDHRPLMTQYIIPEFPSFFVLSLFMIAALLTIIFCKKKAKLSSAR